MSTIGPNTILVTFREPVEITKKGKDFCGRSNSCFELKVPPNTTMLQAYNCERQRGPKKEVMPAEKQVCAPMRVAWV